MHEENIRSHFCRGVHSPMSGFGGAGEGNRTLVISLEGCCSTIELHPHREPVIRGRHLGWCGTPPLKNSELKPASEQWLVGEVGLEPTKA
jgi:hypothetical protein